MKYKTKSDKVQTSTQEAEEQAKRDAEEAARREEEQIEEERLEAERQKEIWYARPGPVPVGWTYSLDEANGREFYWHDDDPHGTTTWERPACIGEEHSHEDMLKVVEQLRKQASAPQNGYWQWALQKLWMMEEPEEGHGSCNLQRPGSTDENELATALTLLRYFLKGPKKDLQDSLLRTRHLPHEKLPQHLHNAGAVARIIELLSHDEEDVRHGAACVLAAGCCGAHRGFQDAISMSGSAIPLLLDLLWDEATVQAAALALGRACEHGHRGNQDAITKIPSGASQLLDLIEHEDANVAKTVQYAIFWANVNAHPATKTHWDRSRGLCVSLSKPRQPCFLWEPAFCRRHHLEQFVGGSKAIKDGGRADIKVANDASLAKSGRVSVCDQYLALMLSSKGEEEIQNGSKDDRKESKARTRSKRLHTDLGNQAPNHAHQRLQTRHDKEFGHHHLHGDIFDELESSIGSRTGSHAGSRMPSKIPLSRMGSKIHGNRPLSSSGKFLTLEDSKSNMLTLPEGSRPNTQEQEQLKKAVSLPNIASSVPVASMPSHRSMRSSFAGTEASDYDLHHVDPALDDQGVCRIGQEVRHCTQTGFLKPLGSNKRYGICT